MSGRARRRGLIVVLAVVAVGLLWGGWSAWEIRRDRKDMADVREEIRAGRHGTAARKLMAILDREPDWDEAAYLLGTCSKARGREKAAAEAWARVPPDSPFAPRAIQGLVELEVEGGRFADAERLVERAMNDPRIDGSGLPLYLGPIYTLQGRIEDAERSVEARWTHLNEHGEGASEKAINLVRLHRELRRNVAARRDHPRRPRPGRAVGTRRRSRLAGEGQPGTPHGCTRRGEAMARRLSGASPRRYRRLARPARVGDGDEPRRCGAGGREASAGRRGDARPGPEGCSLAGQTARGSRVGAAGTGTPHRGRSHRSRRHGSTGRAGPTRQHIGSPAPEDRDRST